MMRLKNIFYKDFIILTIILILGFVIVALESQINPPNSLNMDEKLWVLRSFNYISSILKFDFINSLQTVHPGITVMAISGVFVYLAHYLFSDFVFYDSYGADIYSIAFNAPFYFMIILFPYSFYYILRKLGFERIIAFFVIMLFSINSAYIFNSTPVDKFATISILLSLSFLLIYTNNKYNSKKYLFLSSFFAAFGALSKFSVLILLPFNLFVLLYFSSLSVYKLKGAIKDYFIYLSYFLFSALLIFPGFLLKPFGVINKIFNSGNNVLISGLGNSSETYTFFEKIVFYSQFFRNAWVTPFGISLFLAFILFFLVGIFKKGTFSNFSRENLFYKNIVILGFFGCLYFFYAMIFTTFLYYRYIMPIFFIIDILSAIALFYIITWYKNKFNVKRSLNKIALSFFVIFYIFQFVHLFAIYLHRV